MGSIFLMLLDVCGPFLFGPILVVLLGWLVLGRKARAIAKVLSGLFGAAFILASGTLVLFGSRLKLDGHPSTGVLVYIGDLMAGAGLIGSQLGLLLIDFLGARFPRTAGG